MKQDSAAPHNRRIRVEPGAEYGKIRPSLAAALPCIGEKSTKPPAFGMRQRQHPFTVPNVAGCASALSRKAFDVS
ncbi:hypothetical protein [Bosea beijingensis]